MSTKVRGPLFLGLVLGWIVACGTDRREAPERQAEPAKVAPTSASSPAVGAALNLSSLARRSHFAFRAEGRSWRVSHDTYQVRVSAEGLSVAPVRVGRTGSSLMLGESRVGRGTSKSVSGRASLGDDGHVSIDRGAAREEIAGGEDGIEQSWHFAARPPGEGDVVVRIAVAGERYAGETPWGLHFASDEAPLGIRYGLATWIDAAGRRTDLHPRYSDGEIVLRVPREVVDGAAYPAVLDPLISTEFGMDAPVVSAAPQDQIEPAAAYGGTNHLVVWNDARQLLRGTILYGARVTPQGTVLDPTGIPLVTATVAGSQHEVTPALASNGTDWLLAFADSGYLFVTHVQSDGTPGGATIVSTGSNNSAPQIAYDGTNYLVAWLQGSSIVGVRVAPDGSPVDAAPVTILSNTCTTTPALAYSGTKTLVACTDGANLFYSLVTPAFAVGPTLHPFPAAPPGTLTAPVAAATASQFFLALQTTDSNSVNTGIFDAAGNPLVIGTNFVGMGSGTGVSKMSAIYAPKVDASQFLLAWSSQVSPTHSVLRAARIATSGASLDGPTGVVVEDETSLEAYPAASADGTNYLLAFQDTRGGNDDVYAARFTSGLTPLDALGGTLVSGAGNTEILPSLAYSSPNYLVAWEDLRGAPAIYAERVTVDGTPLDAPAIAVTAPGNASAPVVAGDATFGGGWGVVWQASGTVRGTSVLAGGAIGPGGPLSGGTQESAPSGACDGTYCLVVWQDGRNAGTTGTHVYGVLANASGPVPGSETQITTAAGDQLAPQIAYSGGVYVVTYQIGGANKDIGAMYVTSSGGVITPSAPFSVATTADQEANPAIATDGASFFVTWDQGAEIRGALVKTAGGLQGSPFVLVNAPAASRLRPKVVYDGGQYVVVWMDRRAGNWDVYSARVLGGAVVDANGTLVSGTSTDEIFPAVASAGGRQSLVVYDSFAASGAFRVEARTFDDKQPQGAACQTASDCIVPNCVDHFCCSGACSGGCQACSIAKTGQPNGTCANVVDGTDPNASCAAPPLACESSACVSGACATAIVATRCVIANACVASGAVNPGNACQSCQPAQSQTAWTTTTSGCSVGGTCYADGTINPANGCQKCVASSSTTAWTDVSGTCADDGLGCTADICIGGACTHPIGSGSCVIGNACVAANATNPANACQACIPSQNATGWTDMGGCTDAGASDAGDGGACVPLTCPLLGPTACGLMSDGCGGLLDCGACTAPATCGGGGVPNRCGQADGGAGGDGGSGSDGGIDAGGGSDGGIDGGSGSDGGNDAGSGSDGGNDGGSGSDASGGGDSGGPADGGVPDAFAEAGPVDAAGGSEGGADASGTDAAGSSHDAAATADAEPSGDAAPAPGPVVTGGDDAGGAADGGLLPPNDASGCSCRVTRTEPSDLRAFGAMALGILGLLRRRGSRKQPSKMQRP